ncbi:hypothetical protein AZF01_01225 [Martelella sp. AD-3]|nr:hypothetical protein AZF01_01225 [Martelella sp. AD-3]
MANDEERLLVLVEARIRDLEKNMAKASRTADRHYDRMRRSSRTATRNMQHDMNRSTTAMNKALASTTAQIGTFGKAFAGGIIGGLTIGGLTAIVSKVRDVAGSVAEVGYQAKIAGVDVRSFQELQFVAERNRISVSALTDGLKEMNLRADEFIFTKGKSGSAAEAFRRLGYDADTLAQKLQNPSALFAEIIGRLQRLDSAAQIRVADEIFGGTGGEEFVKLIDEGEEGIRRMIGTANDLGVIMDEELIDKAAELDRQFGIVADTVETALKSAIVNAASALASFLDTFRDFENRSTKNLEIKQSELARERVSLENQILETENNPNMTDQSRRRTLNNLKRQLNEKNRQDAEITQVLNDRFYPSGYDSDTIALPPVNVTTSGSGSGDGGGGGGRSADQDRRAVERLIQALKDEQATLGMAERDKEIFNNLRRAGAAATKDEQAAITQLTGAIYDQKEAQHQASETADFFRQTASDAFLAFIPVIETGNAALDNMINKLAEAAAQAALFGDGPLAGLFGGGLLTSLLPAHATGTNFAPGGVSLVGERGPELVNLPRGSQVLPNHQLHGMRQASGGVVNNIRFGNINVSVPEGTDPTDAAAIGKAVRREFEGIVDKRLQENRRARGMLAGGPF